MVFSNHQIDIDSLPSYASVEFIQLEKKYLSFRLISTVILWLILLIGMIIGFSLGELWQIPYLPLVSLMVWGIGFLISLLLTIWGVRVKAYALREKDIIYRSGLIWRSITTIPFNRIQHIEINSGPIERSFNLTRLKVFTAGGSGSDLTIPGLLPEISQEIKSYIIKQSALDE